MNEQVGHAVYSEQSYHSGDYCKAQAAVSSIAYQRIVEDLRGIRSFLRAFHGSELDHGVAKAISNQFSYTSLSTVS